MSKFDELVKHLKAYDGLAIAFSGGVDSTFLAKAAALALEEKAIAITIDTPYIPRWELEEAKQLAEDIGISHHILQLEMPAILENNPANRCYLCKGFLFNQVKAFASSKGISQVADGSNLDDTKDYRPGMVALRELEVISPLLDLGWRKEDIRSVSKELGLATFDKPAYACLLTRLPYDEVISPDSLKRIERAEVYMHKLGFKAVRVRDHGNLARIEISREDRKEFLQEDLMDQVSQAFKELGYTFVTLELSGYEMGSLNKTLGGKDGSKKA